jgi:hypothetical protein
VLEVAGTREQQAHERKKEARRSDKEEREGRKEEKMKRKEKRRKKENRKGGVLLSFDLSTFFKTSSAYQRSRSIRGAAAGAIFGGAVVLSNRLLVAHELASLARRNTHILQYVVR